MHNVGSLRSTAVALLAALAVLATTEAQARRHNDVEKLADAAHVLDVFTTDEQHGIPVQILEQARGILVVPNLFRGGFVIGGRRGRGVLSIRSPSGAWSNPAFVTLTGGSVGAQIGAESADLVLVFANDRSVRNIQAGKFTVGGDASAIGGPMGRRTSGVISGKAEVYAYMHSRGLFAGATFEGLRLDIDEDAGDAFYARSGVKPLGEQGPNTPASTLPFLDALRRAAMLPGPPVGGPGGGVSQSPSSNEGAVTFPLDQAPQQ
ncbi:MAG TPA: lipid-binding SYLF domain-containing protein [Gammaproteobacteria bacterium]|nr:lipid-binding SYLF domain-containing protein [Gammaproteobacteria bacterium]